MVITLVAGGFPMDQILPAGTISAWLNGSRRAVLRRSEGTCLSSRSDDEVGVLQGAIRAE
jgi:hypothetical protein